MAIGRNWTRAVLSLSLALNAAPTIAAAAKPSCMTSPAVVSPCFSLRGRLSIYNGSYVERLWPVGTKRLIALVNTDDTDADLPKSLTRRFDLGPPTTVAIFGVYEVCPITRQRPGVMQHACLVKASHLVATSLWAGHPLTGPR
jgi:hypothetical protein